MIAINDALWHFRGGEGSMSDLGQIDQDKECGILVAFLDLIARDIEERPEALKPISNDTFEYMRQLYEARKTKSALDALRLTAANLD